MPSPRESLLLPDATEGGGVTELRVHGIGVTPPAAVNGDPAPELASGSRIRGPHRTSDHHASSEDRDANQDVDRHVEVYAAGGLSSGKSRIFWLALLPFLLGNMAGWMCSVRTRQSRWRFRLHRLAYGLGALALTVNAFLVAVMITADIIGYQVPRAGLARDKWWLAPLRWHYVTGHPARQVTLGVLVPVLLLLVLAWVTGRSYRYENVRPHYQMEAIPTRGARRMVTAATLKAGLADNEFWDGGPSIRVLTSVHVAAAAGFLAIVLGVTVRALAGGSPHVSVLGWEGVALGAATIALAVAYIVLDALDTPSMATPDATPTMGVFAEKLRGLVVYLLVPASAGLMCSVWFAWLQPGAPSVRAAGLPGMAGVTGWTALAIAVPVAAALVSVLLGLSRGGERTLFGGPWIILVLAFSLLNMAMLGFGIVVANIAGPVTGDAALAVSKSKIYLPYIITAGIPLVAVAALVVGVVFMMARVSQWMRAARLPEETRSTYFDQAREFMERQTDRMKYWYQCGVMPVDSAHRGDLAPDWLLRTGSPLSPRCSCAGAGCVMPAGCCGQSSSHSWLQSCAHGSFTCSRQGSSAPSESASLPWRCQCG